MSTDAPASSPPPSLSNAPLVFHDRYKIVGAALMGLMGIVLLWPIPLLWWMHQVRPHEALAPGALICAPFPVFGLYAFWVAFKGLRTRRTLVIDAQGLHYTVNGSQRHYAWADIVGLHEVTINNRATVLQVRLLGQLVQDERANLLYGNFGLDDDALRALVDEGRTRWGSAPSLDG